jgi:hypothetical protein
MLNYAGDGTMPVTVDLQTDTASFTGGFSGIYSLTDDKSTTLVGPNTTNTWNISRPYGGTLNGTSFTFASVQSLVGGSGVDTSQFTAAASRVASINGGGAPAGQGDWLDYSQYPGNVIVNLTSGAGSTGVSAISNIQNVFGTSMSKSGIFYSNMLIGNTQGNILIGGAGNNTITGGSGASLLIGGIGAASIVGGSGGDLLIGGYTTYDQSYNQNHQEAMLAALMSILAEWQSSDDNNTRFQRIEGLQSGGLNGPNTLNFGTTVLDNSVVDSLTGGNYIPGALDWFFGGTQNKLNNYETGEHINNN